MMMGTVALVIVLAFIIAVGISELLRWWDD
jgi:hypothetical protein